MNEMITPVEEPRTAVAAPAAASELSWQVKAVRLVAWAEGLSLILLLFIAMPAKYQFDYPVLVKWVGSVHGGLFLLYIAALLAGRRALRWSWGHVVLAVVASSVPFALFFPRFHAPRSSM